ncbi:Ubiquitin-conjugating enzyme E2 T [Podila epigama]|nr:Ubiquitin-conjugating enzyme E2 T [Podila epigama]
MTHLDKRTALRMRKELKDLETSPPLGIICYPVDDNIFRLQAELTGPPDSPYSGGTFKIDIQIPERGLGVQRSATEFKENRALFLHNAAKYTMQYAMGEQEKEPLSSFSKEIKDRPVSSLLPSPSAPSLPEPLTSNTETRTTGRSMLKRPNMSTKPKPTPISSNPDSSQQDNNIKAATLEPPLSDDGGQKDGALKARKESIIDSVSNSRVSVSDATVDHGLQSSLCASERVADVSSKLTDSHHLEHDKTPSASASASVFSSLPTLSRKASLQLEEEQCKKAKIDMSETTDPVAVGITDHALTTRTSSERGLALTLPIDSQVSAPGQPIRDMDDIPMPKIKQPQVSKKRLRQPKEQSGTTEDLRNTKETKVETTKSDDSAAPAIVQSRFFKVSCTSETDENKKPGSTAVQDNMLIKSLTPPKQASSCSSVASQLSSSGYAALPAPAPAPAPVSVSTSTTCSTPSRRVSLGKEKAKEPPSIRPSENTADSSSSTRHNHDLVAMMSSISRKRNLLKKRPT